MLLALSPFGLFVVATQLQFACHPPLPLPLSPLRLPLTATQSSHLSSPPHHAPRVASALRPRPFPAPSLTTIPRCQHPHRIQALCLLTLVEQSLHRGGGWDEVEKNEIGDSRAPACSTTRSRDSLQSSLLLPVHRIPHLTRSHAAACPLLVRISKRLYGSKAAHRSRAGEVQVCVETRGGIKRAGQRGAKSGPRQT